MHGEVPGGHYVVRPSEGSSLPAKAASLPAYLHTMGALSGLGLDMGGVCFHSRSSKHSQGKTCVRYQNAEKEVYSTVLSHPTLLPLREEGNAGRIMFKLNMKCDHGDQN